MKTTTYKKNNGYDGSRYTFSAKEKDTETGYGYFGARYYSSDLSIWLSVDPMTEKYPHQSNYVYCSNNPIKIIDPNGEDEWDMARDGTMAKRENGRTDIDIVHAKNKDGEHVSRNFEAGSINNAKDFSKILHEGTTDAIPYTTNYMEFSNSEMATDFFEFAADYSNVEWGLRISDDKSIVGTSHKENFVSMYLLQGMTMDIHSHISKNTSDYSLKTDNPMAAECAAKGVNYKVLLQGTGTYATYNTSKRSLSNRELTKTTADRIKNFMNLNIKW